MANRPLSQHHRILTTVALFLILSVTLSSSQSPATVEAVIGRDTRPVLRPQLKSDPETCAQKKSSCGACITQGCAWCYYKTAGSSAPQCLSPDHTENCPPGWEVELPKGSATPGPVTPDAEDYSISITPDSYDVKLRVGQTISVPLKLHVSENQELDLYHLTDISGSMKDILDLVKEIGSDIEQTMESKTSKFSIGFGTFIDKDIIPYFAKAEDIVIELPSEIGCDSSFSYCNAMALKEDAGDEFNAVVGQVLNSVSSNKDALEGGLDALLQVLTCGDAIGWRKSARKMVLFTTVDGFKYAGDGRLAGIDEINDGLCHLDAKNKSYTHSRILDYPSVAQIQTALEQNGVNIVFAVSQKVLPVYDALKDQLESRATTAIINDDSSNILKIVDDVYNSIVSTLELESDAPEHIVKVEFVYKCPEGGLDKCEGLLLGTTVDIFVKVTLLQCPTKQERIKISITSTGLRKPVVLDVTSLCSCDCQQISEDHSSDCSSAGSLTCGMCKCFVGNYGDKCQCSGTEANTNQCREDTSSSAICSGHGQCVCGTCVCETLDQPKEYQGNFCECSNFQCPKSMGELCGGHGTCACDKCQCSAGWKGDECSCDNGTKNCQTDVGSSTCSGHGDCVCNKCECGLTGRVDKERYTGKLCSDCPTCSGECNSMATCARCHLSSTGDSKVAMTEEACSAPAVNHCNKMKISILENDKFDSNATSKCVLETLKCRRTYYYYRESSNTTSIVIVREWSCDTPIWVIVLSVVGSVVAIGIFTLIIWLIIDRRREIKEAKLVTNAGKDALNNVANMNQLYRDPNSETQNPMFGKNM